MLPVFLLLFISLNGVSAIGCFVCSSFDGENEFCEDPFNSTLESNGREREAGTVSFYHHPCWAYKKGRSGLFPADHCIKIVGHRGISVDNASRTMVIRTCALDSGTLTADTEIVRISHCGTFKYEGLHYAGCVQSCDGDGCNASTQFRVDSLLFILLIVPLFRIL